MIEVKNALPGARIGVGFAVGLTVRASDPRLHRELVDLEAREGRKIPPGNSAVTVVRMCEALFGLQMKLFDCQKISDPVLVRAEGIFDDGGSLDPRVPDTNTTEVLLLVFARQGQEAQVLRAAQATIDKLTMYCGGMPQGVTLV